MLGRGYDDILQPAHFTDMPGMIPELRKEVNRSQDRYYLIWHPQNCRRDKQQGEITKEIRHWLPQGTGQVKLLAAVVDDMLVPEKINAMA